MPTPEKYHLALRVMHWVIALTILSLLTLGFYMISPVSDGPGKGNLYWLHKALGFTVFWLIMIRLSIRLSTRVPPLETDNITKALAKSSHVLLYILPLIMTLSGYLLTAGAGKKLIWFFNLEVPMLIGSNGGLAKQARFIHYYAAWSLVALIILHIAGALKHVIIEKYNVFRRIL